MRFYEKRASTNRPRTISSNRFRFNLSCPLDEEADQSKTPCLSTLLRATCATKLANGSNELATIANIQESTQSWGQKDPLR